MFFTLVTVNNKWVSGIFSVLCIWQRNNWVSFFRTLFFIEIIHEKLCLGLFEPMETSEILTQGGG